MPATAASSGLPLLPSPLEWSVNGPVRFSSLSSCHCQGVAPYLRKIVPPVVACLSDQDARVRYYACESMYNISKTVRGEILPYFNDIFDNMAKV